MECDLVNFGEDRVYVYKNKVGEPNYHICVPAPTSGYEIVYPSETYINNPILVRRSGTVYLVNREADWNGNILGIYQGE